MPALFSIAGVSKKNALGRAHGFADATQGTLFFDVARIIAKKRPKAFLLENVKNLRSHDKGRTFDVIMLKRSKTSLGYDVHYKIIDGAHFVPQHRGSALSSLDSASRLHSDWSILNLPPKGERTLKDILHRVDGKETQAAMGIKTDSLTIAMNTVNPKYTLTDNLWAYLQAYAEKHRAAGNGFGFGLVNGEFCYQNPFGALLQGWL